MSEPITAADLRTHLRLVSTAEDTYLGTLITAARIHLEAETDRTIVPKILVLRRHAFPAARDWLELPHPLARGVTSIAYLDSDGASQTWSSSNYRVDTRAQPARVYLAEDADWPDTQDVDNTVTVTYTAGYATADETPKNVVIALLWLAAWWYEQRLPVNIGNIVNELPHHLDRVIWPLRTFLIHQAEIASVQATEDEPGAGIQRGHVDIASGDQTGDITFSTAYDTAPAVLVWVEIPDGDGDILHAVPHTVATTGFTWLLNSPTPATGYVLRWEAKIAV